MLLKVKEKGKLGGGDQILGVLKFFKSSLMTKLSMCSIQFLLLLYHFLCVYANVILWSNSGSFLPDILPPFSLNPGFHTEASWIQKQSCMQSCIYVNPTSTECSALWMENAHQFSQGLGVLCKFYYGPLRWEYVAVFGSFACLFLYSGITVNYCTVNKAVTVV